MFDGYFELRLGPWDVAAGGVIVREAGGVVTDWARRRPGAGCGRANILAGPPAVHAVLLELIAAEIHLTRPIWDDRYRPAAVAAGSN